MHPLLEFVEFPSIPRLSREMVVTEKIDGTNSQVSIWLRGELPDGAAEGVEGTPFFPIEKDGTQYVMAAGSRNRWLSATKTGDNFGFARWVADHAAELLALGPGHHYGEWWGSGIQRGYGLLQGEKRFSLFNTKRWTSEFNNQDLTKYSDDNTLSQVCIEVPVCYVTPVLARGLFRTETVDDALTVLQLRGSFAAPGFMKPEGIVVYHVQGNLMFKKTLGDDGHKSAKSP